MIKRILVWLPLLFSGTMLFASSSSSCMADALRDAADEIEGTPQDLGDVGSWDDLVNWFDGQVSD